MDQCALQCLSTDLKSSVTKIRREMCIFILCLVSYYSVVTAPFTGLQNNHWQSCCSDVSAWILSFLEVAKPSTCILSYLISLIKHNSFKISCCVAQNDFFFCIVVKICLDCQGQQFVINQGYVWEGKSRLIFLPEMAN